MTKTPKKSADDERSPEETERIADQTLKKLLSTPPKPRTKSSAGEAAKNKRKT